MKCLVVHNPASGRALSADKLNDIFRDQGYDITKFIATGSDFDKRLKKSINHKSIVAVVGGDGTIGSAVGPIVEAGATLLSLPGGTLNHFTKDLGIDQSIAAALRRGPKSETRQIDVASVNNRYFINNSSLGLYPISLMTRKRFEAKLGKWPAALIGAARALVSFHNYYLTIDGKSIVTPFVFIGNNHYDFSTLKIGARHQLDQGILTVAIATTQTRFQLFKTFLLTLVRRLDTDHKFELYTVSDSLTINSRRHSIHVSTDGEVRALKPPLTYKIHKKALKVRV